MAETIVLDPTEVAASRTQVDITPWVKSDGIDWGDAEIAAYMADQARGASPVDFRVPNRMVTIPLVVKAVGGTSFATARTTFEAKAALFQREGGWLKRLTSTGGTVFADVVNATLKLGGGWMQAHKSADLDAQMTLEVLPDFYGSEVTLPDHVTTTEPELVFTETGILGDYSSRCRIVVDEDDGDRQLGLIWGLRSRNYDAAATARLTYNAGTLTPQDAATVSSTMIEHTTVSSSWTPILKTDIIPSGALTHVGTYRVWVSVAHIGSADQGVDVRLLWDVGDLSTPVVNSPQRIPAAAKAFILDLGEVRLDRAPSGTHRWQGQVQAKAAIAPADLIFYKVWIVPVDEGYGVLRAPVTSATSFTAFVARDGFDQTAGTLTGKTAPTGGVWAGAGDANDFDVEATGHTATRGAVSDLAIPTSRFAISGASALTSQLVQVDFKTTSLNAGLRQGVLARYIDINNWAMLSVNPSASNCIIYKCTTGTVVQLDYARPFAPAMAVGEWFTARLMIEANGSWYAWVFPQNATNSIPVASGQESVFATAGALASGKPGINDAQLDASASTRNYDNFLAYVPTTDAVLHPSQSAELRWDGCFREDAAGVVYGPVPSVDGDNPRLPPAGLEGRTCEVFIKASRGDFATLPDTSGDDISARIAYRPCWLFVP